jgi:hypothetical protein
VVGSQRQTAELRHGHQNNIAFMKKIRAD